MAEEGQALWDAIVAVRGVPAPEFHQLRPDSQRVWRTVERTIANEALRRAAQVTRAVQARYSGRSDVDRGGWMAAEDIADGMNALIKEPGHE